ncbi:SUKH-4 family immunity protein [Streptomyces sp. NPDC006193]|uniref:SUKH-4 family immunity protein n=1 Tax=Streptomyces sp. NPDC006193 TaxID=3155717 RepID=UPI0033BC3BC8
MLFSVDHDTLTAVGLVDEVSRLSEATARRYGFSGDTLDFLVRTGLPSSDAYDLWFGPPQNFDPGFVWDFATQAEQGWVNPDAAETVVKLGGFLTSSVAADPRTGVVYQYTEGTKQVVPIHGDVSSLAHTAVTFLGYIESRTAGDDEDDDARRRREVEALMAGIRDVDPLPFAHEHSGWNEMFENLWMGIYT